MAENTFADKLLREVIFRLNFGLSERKVEAYVKNDDTFDLPTIYASITYNFENGLLVRTVPITAKKMLDHENDQRVSLEDYQEFQVAEKAMYGEIDQRNKLRRKEHREAMKEWREKNSPKTEQNVGSKKKSSRLPRFDLAEITKPVLREEGTPLGGLKSNLGILIDNYKDKNCFSAQLTYALVTYQHPDAIMNYDLLKESTDLQSGDLELIMSVLKEKYQVETKYKGGTELSGPPIGNTCFASAVTT